MSIQSSWNHSFLRRPSKSLIKAFAVSHRLQGRKALARAGLGCAPPAALQELPHRDPSTGTGVPWLCEASEHTPELLLHPPVSHSPTAHPPMENRIFTGKNFSLDLGFLTKCKCV